MTSDGQRAITYNYENLPDTINGVSFFYDGNGRRVKKSVTAPAYTVTYIDKLYECVTGAGCGKYIFAGGARIAMKNSDGTYYYHPDHLGSTAVVTDAAGNKAEDDFYLPFGDTMANPVSPFSGVKHEYTSHEMDTETGLYNYNARLYAPEFGRFTSPDSIVPNFSNPQSLNRYAYVMNIPLGYADPTGHSSTNFNIDIGGDFDWDFGDINWNPRFNMDWYNPTINSSSLQNLYRSFVYEPIRNYMENRITDRLANGYETAAFLDTVGLSMLPESIGGAGLMLFGGTLGKATEGSSLIPKLGSKLDYVFGEATGSVHNIERSTQMLSQLERIGLPNNFASRQYLTEHLTQVINDSMNIVATQANRRVVRESILMGINGGVKVQSIWEGTKLITVNIFGRR